MVSLRTVNSTSHLQPQVLALTLTFCELEKKPVHLQLQWLMHQINLAPRVLQPTT